MSAVTSPIRVPAPPRVRKVCTFCGCQIETGADFMWALDEAKRRGRAVLFEEDMCTEGAVFPSNKHAAMLLVAGTRSSSEESKA